MASRKIAYALKSHKNYFHSQPTRQTEMLDETSDYKLAEKKLSVPQLL